ncbi:MAG: hypothetical protein HC941_01460 [Microcoleus sp. SU_5_3]|nr:hypothetical protein [Microcoleus sp. SU_5_3]
MLAVNSNSQNSSNSSCRVRRIKNSKQSYNLTASAPTKYSNRQDGQDLGELV